MELLDELVDGKRRFRNEIAQVRGLAEAQPGPGRPRKASRERRGGLTRTCRAAE